MNQRRRLLQALLAAALGGGLPTRAAAPPPLAKIDRRVVQLGRTPVELVVAQQLPGGLTFVNVHENERTSVRAARELLAHHAGRLIELRGQGRRLVTFWLGPRPHAFDPNRIFTDAGLALTLRRHGSYSPAAMAEVTALREALLALLPSPDGRPLVALHNSGAGRYSIDDYRRGGAHAAEAQAVAVQPADASDDFFLVTSAAWFERLRDVGFNVVLQSQEPTDDGSLSVWCQHTGRPYINVEARHGHLQAQRRMLQAVIEADASRPR